MMLHAFDALPLLSDNIHCPSCVSTIHSILSGYSLPSDSHLGRAKRSIAKSVDSLRSGSRLIRSLSPDRSSTATTRVGPEAYELTTPALTNIDVSIINGTVAFSHPVDFSLKNVIAELAEAGFEIVQAGPLDLERNAGYHPHRALLPTSNTWGRFTDLFYKAPKDREQAHKDNCVACREEESAERKRTEGSSVRAAKGKAAASSDISSQIMRGSFAEATFAIDGMTCT